MTTEEVFRRIITALDQTGIPHMLTGSFASSYHGATRATRDIDFVIAPTAAQLRNLAGRLPPDQYYMPLEAALEALEQQTMFNVVDLVTGWKIDFIIRKSRPFSRTEFDRRLAADYSGVPIRVATVEDVIIAKLEWAAKGRSLRQLEDIADLLRRRGAAIDLPYVQGWVADLGVERQWEEARRLSQPSRPAP